MGDNSFATGYALGADSADNRSNGGWGMDGGWAWIWIILIFAIFGWGNGGWGGNGNGGGNAMPYLGGIATRSDISEGFALNNITSGITGIQQGICDATYALNNAVTGGFNASNVAMLQGFNGVQSQFCNMAAQNQACCCETQRQIERGFADTNYNLAQQSCETRNQIANSTRDLIDNQNANYRGIMDFMVQSKIDALQSENQTLKLAASQAAQNAFITANQEAQTAELIRRLNPSPVPAYAVPAPYPYCVQPTNCGNSCGGCC